jgi:hypothetical protein
MFAEPKATALGDNVGFYMFQGCTSLVSLPANFNLLQNLTTVGNNFANYMFASCSSLVINSILKFPQELSQTEVDKSSAFSNTFYNCTAVQIRTAASIIGALPTPNTAKNTFTNSGFSDALTIPANWR